MTMHIYFNQDKDGYKKDWSGYVERSLARRFCENGIAIPYHTHLDNVYDSEQAKKNAKEKADEEKKADLLAKKNAKSNLNAMSKKPKQSEKAVKK